VGGRDRGGIAGEERRARRLPVQEREQVHPVKLAGADERHHLDGLRIVGRGFVPDLDPAREIVVAADGLDLDRHGRG